MNQSERHSHFQVRSVFVSDLHLGFRFARAQALLGFLQQYQPESLYLVGDFLDGWRLNRRWYWPAIYNELVDQILKLVSNGTRIFYTPGNHDAFLRGQIPSIGGIEIADHFIHQTADGRRLCVTHGDLFDSVEGRLHRLSQIGGRLYDGLTWINFHTNHLLDRFGARERNYSFWLKRTSKRLVRAVSDFESLITDFAKSHQCEGVICGHIHLPCLITNDEFVYCNTGDWVEHKSGLVELFDGTLRLINDGETIGQLAPQVRKPEFTSSLPEPALYNLPTAENWTQIN